MLSIRRTEPNSCRHSSFVLINVERNIRIKVGSVATSKLCRNCPAGVVTSGLEKEICY